MKQKTNCQGCLIGGAAGDALGYAVEFQSRHSILKQYGKDGITDYQLVGDTARFSDDTQMTLFTAEGLLLAESPETSLESIQLSYLDWLGTQENEKTARTPEVSRLLRTEELYARRAPGITCLGALHQGGNGTITKPLNNSKGCGGVMRVAPIGLYLTTEQLPARQIDLLGAQAAALTHGHDLGWIPSAGLVHMVRLLSQEGASMKESAESMIAAMQKLFPDAPDIGFFTELMSTAVLLAKSRKTDVQALETLGEGWVGEEALAVALFCALRYEDDFDLCLRVAVNHDGDSDSTGAVAGNLLGARLGMEGIPAKYLHHLELKDLILEMGADMAK